MSYRYIIIGFLACLFHACAKEQTQHADPNNLLAIEVLPDTGVADAESFIKITVSINRLNEGINSVSPEKRKVTFSTNLGEFLFDSAIQPDGEGNCVNYLKSESPGIATITAILEDYSVSAEVVFSEPLANQFIDPNGIVGGDSVVADGSTVLVNKIKIETQHQLEREFKLDLGQFSNGVKSIKVLPESDGYYVLQISSKEEGTGRLKVVINNKEYLIKHITYTKLAPVNSGTYSGPTSLIADSITYLDATVDLNLANAPELRFHLDRGVFDNNLKEKSIMPDASGNYNLRIRSESLGSDNLKVEINGKNYLVEVLTYTSSFPDRIEIGIQGANPLIEYEPFKTNKVIATMKKAGGKINLNTALPVSFRAEDSNGNTIGSFINFQNNPHGTTYTADFYLSDTTYRGFITFKATESSIPLNGQVSIFYEPK